MTTKTVQTKTQRKRAVQEPVRRLLGQAQNVLLIEPQDYLPFVYLMTQAHLIITDFGGVQEEAPSLGKPVLVVLESTSPVGATEQLADWLGQLHARLSARIADFEHSIPQFRKPTQSCVP
ncbi:MAG: UDP-N-acetylglucosamine 2-epimerase [Chromatiaceae bacterium]|nr:UDP-N-acetylglucosamine 2-epimerase [Chromatiaceae bacterium]MCF8004317.1 UDP-N-acetylglucosamine 2-epimerase [Chromatiaceae bacterium]